MQFEAVLRRPLFQTMMRAELMPQHRQGAQMIRDAEMIRQTVSSNTASTLCDLPWTPIFIVMCFLLHPLLGIVALAGAVIIFSLALITERLTKSAVDRANQFANDANGMALAAIRNGDAVRGLGMGDMVLERWSGAQSALVSEHALAAERTSAVVAVSKFFRMAVQTALLCAGAWLAIDQSISPGAILASSIVMGRALAPVEQMVAQWKRIIAFRQSYQRLQTLFEAIPEEAQATQLPTPEGKLDVEKIVVWPITSNRPTVKQVSFALKPGESCAIVGASGSGKSSLAKALAGVWPVRDGHIRIDGSSYSQWDQNRLGKHIGYLPQDVELFSGTVAENIARLGDVDDDAVIVAAKAAGAHDAILRLPKGYDTPIGEGGFSLSGGMRQRVGLARALYGDPMLIILDEPNSNLDDEGERALNRAIEQMKQDDRTIIVVTHRPAILNTADKVLVMSFGQSIAFGAREEVISKMRGNRVAVVHDSGKPAVQKSA
jgi:ATP-binding cassette subfamily C protein/ATP-binding cassette subfamily C protein EexD